LRSAQTAEFPKETYRPAIPDAVPEPKVCAARCYNDQAAKETRMLVDSITFIAAVFVIAGAVLGALALVCWHTRPQDGGKPHKKPPLSNWK
jgi:hypothetical protein